MIVFLRFLFAAPLLAMLTGTLGAGMRQGVFEAVLPRQQAGS